MPLSIRNALPADETAIVTLWRACGLTTSYNDPGTDLRFALAGDCSTVLVGEDADRGIVGTVMVGHDGHRGWLYYVAAALDARGEGFGRAMVEAGEAWLKARGVPKVQLMVRNTNAPVAAFYEHLAYEESPVIVMSKWLK